MADLVTAGLVGSVVDKLLTKVIEAASLALQHNKYCQELHTLLTRLQPLVSDVCSKADVGTGGSAAHNWLQSFYKELKEADEVLQESSKIHSLNMIEKFSSSKRIVRVMHRISRVVQEVGLVGLASTQSVGKGLESLREVLSLQMASVQHELSRSELAMAARSALLMPACNYGHTVGSTTVDHAFSQIKGSADSVMWMNQSHPSPLYLPSTSAAVPKLRRQDSETVFGGAQVVEDMEQLLLSEDAGIRWLGVWATGGAGKTLSAQRLNNSPALQSHFTRTFWLTVGRARPIHILLQDLSIVLTGRSQTALSSIEDTKNRLCQQVQGEQKVVLFLDDVWDGVLLDWLDVLPIGSTNKYFVTTRNVDILVRKNAVKMQIPMLPAEDSWKLFCWHAFRGADKVLAPLEGIAREVADECKGLPLALKVIGATFAGKTEPFFWRRSLEKLRKAEVLSEEHEQQLLLRLELSLEELPKLHSHLKDCFLYFAAFPEDAQVRAVEDLLDAWVGEGIVRAKHAHDNPELEAYELLGWLIARSLIELQPPKVTSYMRQIFMTCKIHDVLRDLARYTLQHMREPNMRECLYNAGTHLDRFPPEWIMTDKSMQLSVCRLSLAFNSLTELPQQLNAPQLQVLLLRDNPLKELPRGFLKSSKSLKVLDLRNTHITELPSALGSNLKHLVSLNLQHCVNLEKLPDSIGKIKGLRRLDLSSCYKLSSLPSTLSQLTNLQILDLFASFKVWDNNDMQCCYTCVTELLPFNKRAALKDVSQLTELNRLKIDSSKVDKFSMNLNSLRELGSLQVRFEKVEALPEVKELRNLQVLNLEGCRSLRSLPSSLETLPNLITLDLASCEALCTLPALDQLPQLQTLNLTGCRALKGLPSSFARSGAFPTLRELRMQDCREIANFPDLEVGAMPQLALLSLSGWDQLTTSLPQPLQQLKNLHTLDASHCMYLQSLDGSLDLLSLSSLEELDVRNSPALLSLPETLASLPSLKVVNIRLISSGAHIPDKLLQLEAEKRLKIIRH